MSEEQRAYHELEMMQELGMLEEGTNICEILDEYVETKKEKVIETPNIEIENQMVVGEYYSNEGEDNDS